MGGRAAEELAFQTDNHSTSNDLTRATDMALRGVCEWGIYQINQDLSPSAITIRPGPDGRACKKIQREATAQDFNSEIRSIVTRAYTEVKMLLDANWKSPRSQQPVAR